MARKIEFVVTAGNMEGFPLDMLRYDGCHPADSFSVDAMMVACGPKREYNRETKLFEDSPSRLDFKKGFRITLIMDHSPTHGRWESFGWKVESFRKVP